MAENDTTKKSPLSLDYDIEGALREGLDAADIAQYASSKTNYDYENARRSGLSDNDIIAYLVADVEDITPIEAIGEGLKAGIPEGLGFAGGFAAASAALGTTPAGYTLPGAIARGTLSLGAKLISGLAGLEAAKAFNPLAEPGKQYLPEDRPFVKGAEFGALALTGTPDIYRAGVGLAARRGVPGAQKFIDKRTAEPVDFGASRFFERQAWQSNPASTAVRVADDLSEGLRLVKNTPNFKIGSALRYFEDLATQSRNLAYNEPKTALLKELATSVNLGLGAGIGEKIDPGNPITSIGGGLTLAVLAPTRLAGFLADYGSEKIKTLFSQSAREESRAASARAAFETMAKQDARVGGQEAAANRSQTIKDAIDTLRGMKPVARQANSEIVTGDVAFEALEVATTKRANLLDQIQQLEGVVASASPGSVSAVNAENALKPLQDALKNQDENITKIQNVGFAPVPPTILMSDPIITKLVSAILHQNPELKVAYESNIKQNILSTNELLQALRDTGDPQFLDDYMKGLQEHFVGMNELALGNAQRALNDRVKKLAAREGFEDYADANMAMNDTLSNLKKQMRSVEKDFYKEVEVLAKGDESAQVIPKNVIQAYQAINKEREGKARLPMHPDVRAFLSKALKDSPDEILEGASAKETALITELNKIKENLTKPGSRDISRLVNSAMAEKGIDLPALESAVAQGEISRSEITQPLNRYKRSLENAKNKNKLPRGAKAAQQITNINDRIRALELPDRIAQEARKQGQALRPRRFKDSDFNPVTISELMNFRSNMREQALSKSVGTYWHDAKGLGELSEAALDDLGVLTMREQTPIETFGIKPVAWEDALRKAYSFSRAFNDVFTRAYPATIVRRKRNGAPAVPPELTASDWKAGTTQGSLQLRELEDVVRFMEDTLNADDLPAGYNPGEQAKTITDGLFKTLQTILSNKVVKPQGGNTFSVNRGAIQSVLDNPNFEFIFRRPEFSALREELLDINKLDANVKLIKDQQSRINQTMKKTASWQDYVNAETGDTVKTAMGVINARLGTPGNRQPNAVANFKTLTDLAVKSGDENVIDGFVASVVDAAYSYAMSSKKLPEEAPENFFKYFRDYMFSPIEAGKTTSVANILTNSGAVNNNLSPLKKLLAQGDEFVKSRDTVTRTNAELKEISKNISPLSMALIKVLSLQQYQKFAESVPFFRPSGLVEQGVVANIVNKFAQEFPALATSQALVDVVTNPDSMVTLLESINTQIKTNTSPKTFESKLINNYGKIFPSLALPSVNVIMEDMAAPEPTPQQAPPQEMPQAAAPEPRPTAPPQAMQMPAEPTVPLPQQAPPPASPDQRQQYAAMYPFDTVSELIRTGRG